MVTVDAAGTGAVRRVAALTTAPLFAPATWLAATHLVLDLVAGPIVGALVLVGFVVGFALVPVLGLGLVVLPPMFVASSVLATLARRRLDLLLDQEIPPLPPVEGTWRERLTERLRTSWREVSHHVLGLVRGPVLGGLVVIVGAGAVALLAAPLVRLGATDGGWPVHGPVGWVVVAGMSLGGLILLLAWPYLVRAAAGAAGAEAALLLGPAPKALARRVEVLTRTRTAALEAADAERSRIERDLHDGAQQRIVALAMDLGRARAKFDTDPEQARGMLDDAHREAMTALAELRDLARGIAPSVLADRGLDAALSALAARCPVPVDVRIDPGATAERAAEAVVYFCVAEALTNVAKHADATHVEVAVGQESGEMRVTVCDNGVGGARLEVGSGLQGLRDRVSAVDGRLSLDSPPGGPTVLTVEVPCAS